MITTPFEAPKTVSQEKILDFEEILVGGIQYANLCQFSLEPEDMKKYPWVGLGRGSATYELYKDFFIEHRVDMEPDMEVATSDLLLPLIENNLGIGFVPEKLAFVADKGRGRSLAADTFYKYLKMEYSENGR